MYAVTYTTVRKNSIDVFILNLVKKIFESTNLNRTMRRRKLLRRRDGHRNATATVTARVRGVAVVPAEVRR